MMRQLKLFTLLYSVTAIVSVSIGLKIGDVGVISAGTLAFMMALCSSFRWWYRTTVALGKNNVIFGWIVIFIIAAVQLYGLSLGNLGFSPFLISWLILMLIATIDAMNILRISSQKVK
jgi:hypothetical protein